MHNQEWYRNPYSHGGEERDGERERERDGAGALKKW